MCGQATRRACAACVAARDGSVRERECAAYTTGQATKLSIISSAISSATSPTRARRRRTAFAAFGMLALPACCVSLLLAPNSRTPLVRHPRIALSAAESTLPPSFLPAANFSRACAAHKTVSNSSKRADILLHAAACGYFCRFRRPHGRFGPGARARKGGVPRQHLEAWQGSTARRCCRSRQASSSWRGLHQAATRSRWTGPCRCASAPRRCQALGTSTSRVARSTSSMPTEGYRRTVLPTCAWMDGGCRRRFSPTSLTSAAGALPIRQSPSLPPSPRLCSSLRNQPQPARQPLTMARGSERGCRRRELAAASRQHRLAALRGHAPPRLCPLIAIRLIA